MTRTRILAGMVMIAMLATPALSAGTGIGALIITDPFARATPGRIPTGIAYLSVVNSGEDDHLIKASTTASRSAELHTHINKDGLMQMREVEMIEIPASGTAELKPGGYHVMLIGLITPLMRGESFSLTLTFEKAGEVTITVPILGPGAMSAQ